MMNEISVEEKVQDLLKPKEPIDVMALARLLRESERRYLDAFGGEKMVLRKIVYGSVPGLHVWEMPRDLEVLLKSIEDARTRNIMRAFFFWEQDVELCCLSNPFESVLEFLQRSGEWGGVKQGCLDLYDKWDGKVDLIVL